MDDGEHALRAREDALLLGEAAREARREDDARRAAARSLEGLRGYDLRGIRPVLHPVDLVAFEGLGAGRIDGITLLHSGTDDLELDHIRRGISEAIADGRYGWEVLRVTRDGRVP